MRDRVRHIHLVGIGGAGMSGIAEVLLNQGYRVSGSDLGMSAAALRLKSLGAQVQQGHAAAHIDGADVVVVSTAVPPDNVEVAAARARGVPVVPRAAMLAELMRLKDGIAIAGTHGKTTTTSLVAHVLGQGGLDPTFIIGGRVNALGSGARLGAGRYLVVEADESDASFLHLNPILAVVTNVDLDHMDTYGGDPKRLYGAFVEFLQRLPFYGLAVLCQDDADLMALRERVGRPVLTYGLTPDADLHATDLRQDGLRMHFTACAAGRAPLPVTLNLPGRHNVQNALAAIAIAREVGVDDAAIAAALKSFDGIGRRQQRLAEGRLAGQAVTLIDDYGHHPQELKVTLEAVRGAFPGRRLLTVFQPHRYTRTRDLLDDFAAVLSAGTDALLLCEVYAAGEAPIAGADGRALARAIRSRGRVEPVFVEQLAELRASLTALVQDGDVIVTLGAGSIGQAATQLAEQIREGGMNAAAELVRPRLRHHEPMARHTSWRVGGPADVYFEPHDLPELQAFLAGLPAGTPLLWVGLGSNLLVRDGGFRGAVVCLGKGFAGIEPIDERTLRAGAAVPCAKLAQHLGRAGLAGGEFLAGIPGTVGGALAMNAGAHGGETWQRVRAVQTIDRAGHLHRRTPAEYRIAYRSVDGPADEWFIGAEFAFEPADAEQVKAAIHALLRRRAATQPLRQANAGSVFRNPPGDHAARLIEAAGLKGLTVGKARVSTLHANFIVNLGGACAADIETLIDTLQQRVEAAFGVRLEPEVRRVGEAA